MVSKVVLLINLQDGFLLMLCCYVVMSVYYSYVK